jgi:hypothetical protein
MGKMVVRIGRVEKEERNNASRLLKGWGISVSREETN